MKAWRRGTQKAGGNTARLQGVWALALAFGKAIPGALCGRHEYGDGFWNPCWIASYAMCKAGIDSESYWIDHAGLYRLRLLGLPRLRFQILPVYTAK